MCNAAFCDLSQTKVKDDLNQWAGRGHCEERTSTEEQKDERTVLQSRELVQKEKVTVIQKKTRSLN